MTSVPPPSKADPALPPGLLLRPAEDADGVALMRLGRALLAETDHFVRLPEERAADRAEMRQIVEHYRRTPGWLMLNVWQGDIAVAEAVLSLGGLGRTRHVGTLGIGVLQAYWGKGVGRALMAALENHALDQGVERLEFTVLDHNRRARDFYRRLGYDEEGRKRRSVRYAPGDDGTALRYGDEIVMAKWIGPEIA